MGAQDTNMDHLPMWTLIVILLQWHQRLGAEKHCQSMRLHPEVVTFPEMHVPRSRIPCLRLPYSGLLIISAHQDALHRPYTLCPSCKLLRDFVFPSTTILHSLNHRLSASLIHAVPRAGIQSWLEQGRLASCSCQLYIKFRRGTWSRWTDAPSLCAAFSNIWS
jgi:hypothetical protein